MAKNQITLAGEDFEPWSAPSRILNVLPWDFLNLKTLAILHLSFAISIISVIYSDQFNLAILFIC